MLIVCMCVSVGVCVAVAVGVCVWVINREKKECKTESVRDQESHNCEEQRNFRKLNQSSCIELAPWLIVIKSPIMISNDVLLAFAQVPPDFDGH